MITSREFFSPSFISKLEAELRRRFFLMMKKHNIKIGIHLVPDGDECFTDGERGVFIGMLFPIFHIKGLKLKDVVLASVGEIMHEFGHILYTAFSAIGIALAAMHSAVFWPETPDNMSPKMKKYILAEKENADRAYTYYKDLFNIIEDGRIEYLMLNNLGKYHGFILGLKFKRKLMKRLQDSIQADLDEYDKAKADGDTDKMALVKYTFAFKYVFQLAKLDELIGATDATYKHPLFRRMCRINDPLMEALDSVSAEDTFRSVNVIYCDLFDDMILPYLKLLKNDPTESFTEDAQAGGDPQQGNQSSGKSKSSSSKSSSGSQSDGKDGKDGKSGKDAPRTSSAAAAPLQKYLQKSGASQAPKMGNAMTAIEKATQPSKDKAEAQRNAQTGASAVNQTVDTDDGTAMTQTYGQNTIIQQSDGAWGGMSTEWKITKEDRKAELIDLDAVAQIQTETDKELSAKQQQKAKLDAPLSGADFGDAHKNLQWHINQVPEADSSVIDNYRSYTNLAALGKTAARKVRRFIVEQAGVTKSSAYSGKRFRSASVFKPLPKYFETVRKEEPSPDCAIYVVGDQSGSMCGERIAAVKRTFIVLCEMAQQIKQMKFAAFGHHAGGHSVYIDNYILPDENISKAKYKVAKVYSNGCNRDGAALRYVAEILMKEAAEKKLLIMISDGQPNAGGYGGEPAKADIQDAIKYYERFGIKVIAAAIGEDKERIKEIYGPDRFLDITDLQKLPDTLAGLVGRVLKA